VDLRYQDCAAYPISLNLEARKPHYPQLTVSGCMSTPRLGFMENFFSCFEACVPCNVKLRKHGGAFWGQSMTKVFERTIEQDNPDLILTIDYDTVMTAGHLSRMIQTMMLYPEIDALAPIQSSRHHATTLFTVAGEDGKNVDGLPRSALDGDTTPVKTAHFGLTLLRTAAIKKMAKPWFHAVDDDIHLRTGTGTKATLTTTFSSGANGKRPAIRYTSQTVSPSATWSFSSNGRISI
jgi:hypothetical protein